MWSTHIQIKIWFCLDIYCTFTEKTCTDFGFYFSKSGLGFCFGTQYQNNESKADLAFSCCCYSKHSYTFQPFAIYKDILPALMKIPFMYSQKRNCTASVPISTFMCMWAIYILPGSVHICSCSRIGRPIVEINKSFTGTWMWKLGQLGLRPQYSFSGNICIKFSVLCLCSVQHKEKKESERGKGEEVIIFDMLWYL